MYGRVVNKKARWNICIAEEAQEPAYEEGKGRIVSFNALPLTKHVRELLPTYFGEQCRQLNAEGNYYYDTKKCFVNFHGYFERRIVVAVRLGETMNLKYQWYLKSKAVSDVIELQLNDGDIYVMSDKAVGNDWKKRSIYTLRHGAGI